ncbi:MAG: hypothetical protein KDI01_00165 [Halioglobus sp.]|nr:hypothetical protein [Halioglobus sp.]
MENQCDETKTIYTAIIAAKDAGFNASMGRMKCGFVAERRIFVSRQTARTCGERHSRGSYYSGVIEDKVVQQSTGGIMGIHKQSVSFTDQAFAHVQALVEAGEYPTVSAAVSGELARARAARMRDDTLLEAEVQRRLALPVDQWESVDSMTGDVRAWLNTL